MNGEQLRLRICPVSLKEANAFVSRLHRHHKPVVGHKFSIGVCDDDGELHGVAIVGRPVAKATDQYSTLEVTRLCTNGTANACSCLYASCARAAKELGYKHIQTFILESEPGTSLKACGWKILGKTTGGTWAGSDPKTGAQLDIFGGHVNPHGRGSMDGVQPAAPKVKWGRDL